MFKFSTLFALILALSSLLQANPMRPDNLRSSSTVTTTASSPAPAPRLPQLSSVVIMGDYRVANFSNQGDMTIGGQISGYRLIQIEPTYVIVKRGSKTTRLNIQNTGSLTIQPAEEDTQK